MRSWQSYISRTKRVTDQQAAGRSVEDRWPVQRHPASCRHVAEVPITACQPITIPVRDSACSATFGMRLGRRKPCSIQAATERGTLTCSRGTDGWWIPNADTHFCCHSRGNRANWQATTNHPLGAVAYRLTYCCTTRTSTERIRPRWNDHTAAARDAQSCPVPRRLPRRRPPRGRKA